MKETNKDLITIIYELEYQYLMRTNQWEQAMKILFKKQLHLRDLVNDDQRPI